MYPPPLLQQQQHVCFMFRGPCCRVKTDHHQKQKQQRYAVSMRGKSEMRLARDRVIDFGKYKGKMLGSLPSRYLRWISKNLRARDFEEWANLADQVLQDPIYGDRIEWEFAFNVLNGNNNTTARSSGADCELQEISERFGWDNNDKVGWSKVDFDLLGTSKGGRIPRLSHEATTDTQPNDPPPTSTSTANRTKRMERRERQKIRLRINNTHKNEAQRHFEEEEEEEENNFNYSNPFPGRQSLLRKAINHRTQLEY
uniref:Uncharacterized protein LOC101503340 n=2 Tax=Cicer arietinum TaxID=3827 RepID=A0A1S2XGD4_CICAR|nr:uncharacterized protein LOC101503340 [Cicer arietinum]